MRIISQNACTDRNDWLKKFQFEAKSNSSEKWKVLRHQVFIHWDVKYEYEKLWNISFLKGFVQQIYNILIMEKHIIMWWMQLLFIIRLVWQFVKGKILPLMDVLATYMYGFIIRIHMCIWNSLEDLFFYKQTIQVRGNNI